MKKTYFLLLILLSFAVFSQNNPKQIIKQEAQKTLRGELKFEEIQKIYEEYFKTKDIHKKGSGYKPYKRWEHQWKDLVNPDGYLISPQQINSALQLKKNSFSNKTMALPPSNWTPVGPFSHTNTGSWSSGQGRVNKVYVDPNNANTLYIGAPGGGIWKSINTGLTWVPLSDQLAQIGVSGIVADHTNSNIIYIATGDADGSNTYSLGVLKSTDGGATWNPTGLAFNNTNTYAGDIVMHPTDNQKLWCATNIGLFYTSDGGTTWNNIVNNRDFSTGSIRFKPNNPTTIYATTNNRFYRSTNSGATFTNVIAGGNAAAGRLIIDVTAANPNYIYALASDSSNAELFLGIFRSEDSGTSWNRVDSGTDVFNGSSQARYDLALAVSQTNSEELYTGCLNIWKSTDGGFTMTQVNSWSAPFSASYSHADIHYLRFFGNTLYAATDGGIYKTTNGGANFTDLTAGLQISQFYKIAVSKQSAAKMMGGLQDNGGFAYSNNQWKSYYGADGMDTAIDPTNSNKYYGFIQFGSSLNISDNAGNSRASGVSAPDAEVNSATGDSGGNWVTPLTINSIGEVFAGYNSLYKLVNNNWVVQSISTIGTGNVELISIDPQNDDIMYVSNGLSLFKSIDRGINFNEVYVANSSITSICVNYSNSNIVYLTTAGTAGEALKSLDGGTFFASFSQNLPAIAKRVIKHQGRNSLNPLYVGTSLGVYYRDDSMSQWEPFDTGLPNVEVFDLEINLEDSKIIAATHGRGIWQSNIPIEVPAVDIKLQNIQNPTNLISCNTFINPAIEVKNNGSSVINTVNITYNYNGAPQIFNYSGNIASQATQLINIPPFNVASKGVYTLNVNSTTANDAFNDNNTGVTNFYVNDLGTIGQINNFETPANNVLTYNDGATNSQWQRAIRVGGTLNSGAENSVYTTNISGNYPDNTKAFLYSQCYDLTNVSNPRIKFNMKFDLEVNWDIVYVEYTTNNGQTWQVLGTQGTNWYNSSRLPTTTGNDCNNCVGAQWTGTNTTATDYFYDLNTLGAPSNIMFRIVFWSDEAVTQLGVNIDNFVIEGVLSTDKFNLENISIYPNPTNGIFTLNTKNIQIESIEIFDVSGKLIQKNMTNFKNVNISNASAGIYFVKINSNEKSITKKIIKN